MWYRPGVAITHYRETWPDPRCRPLHTRGCGVDRHSVHLTALSIFFYTLQLHAATLKVLQPRDVWTLQAGAVRVSDPIFTLLSSHIRSVWYQSRIRASLPSLHFLIEVLDRESCISERIMFVSRTVLIRHRHAPMLGHARPLGDRERHISRVSSCVIRHKDRWLDEALTLTQPCKQKGSKRVGGMGCLMRQPSMPGRPHHLSGRCSRQHRYHGAVWFASPLVVHIHPWCMAACMGIRSR